MNKREFIAGSVGAVVGASALAQPSQELAARPVSGLRSRTQRLPDLAAAPGAATFEAYVGERFAIAGAPGATLVLRSVDKVARCQSTEQFSLAFAQAGDAPRAGGIRVLQHATGQRLALHLEPSRDGYDAHFNLLA